MPQIKRSALVSFSAEQMYTLVNDAGRYPEFLPGCVDSRIISLTESTQVASLEVAKMGIHKTFTTSNKMTPNRYIELHLVDGPFKKLTGYWNFAPMDEQACRIEFFLDFEFSNILLDFAFGKIFQELMDNIVQAFIQRAKEVYG